MKLMNSVATSVLVEDDNYIVYTFWTTRFTSNQNYYTIDTINKKGDVNHETRRET